MTRETTQNAIECAVRFIQTAGAALAVEYHDGRESPAESLWRCKENAAAKRASMDLTRALAEMRSRV